MTKIDDVVSSFVEFEMEHMSSAQTGKEVVDLVEAVNTIVYVSTAIGERQGRGRRGGGPGGVETVEGGGAGR